MNASGPHRRTRVKICGITRPEDGLCAAELGADAIGLVFVAASPRAVNIMQAAEIVSVLPPFVTRVGLFVDADVDQVETILKTVAIDLLQFHGDESEAYCAQFGRPYIKAVSMRPDRDVVAYMQSYHSAAGFLLDAYHPAVAGGSGEQFDWARVPKQRLRPIVLAGGLHAGNITQAVRQVRPYAVDVSSGVESAKGIKDAAKVADFIRGVQRGDDESPT